MEPLDHDYLEGLVMSRDLGDVAGRVPAYFQGRIDEYCAQNAIGSEDADGLDLRLPDEP